MTTPGPGRRWLVLSYFSHIDGMAPSQHLDDRLPHLRAAGVEPLLLTGVCGTPWTEYAHARARSVAPSGIRFELRHAFRRRRASGAGGGRVPEALALFPVLPFYILEKAVADLDSQWSWFPLAARRGLAICRERGPEAIYSTGGPWSAHVAAARIARRTGLPWIAELQDPLVHGDWQRGRAALRAAARVERTLFREADAVVFLTGAAMRAAQERTGVRGKAFCIYPGADPLPPAGGEYRRGEACRFAHFGSLGGSRNLKVFLEALARLFRERPDLARVVRLDVYGGVDRLSKTLSGEFPFPGTVTLHGRVPRREAVAAMRRSDVLLLVQNTEVFSAETIPSKTYEYLQVGRPVLGLVHRNPELAAMLSGQGHAAADASDPAAVAAAVGALADRWSRGGLPPAQGASPYTVAEAVRRLATVAEEAVRRRKGARHA